jgi:YHS domain-containing protein
VNANPIEQELIMKLTNPIKSSLLGFSLVLALLALVSIAAHAEDKKDAAKPYPLEKCIVSDEKLGGMGKPYVFTHEGQEIKLCCKSCLKDFKKEPAKYLKKLDAAAKPDKK